jgi:8-oxo-dGTP diphosphatase
MADDRLPHERVLASIVSVGGMPEHVVSVAVIIDGPHVLLAHRHPERDWYPDCWDLIGGHVEPNEEPLDALRRECQEELGIAVQAAEPLVMRSSDPTVEVHAFVITSWTGTPTNRAPDEHDELRWFHPRQLTDLPLADPAVVPGIIAAFDRHSGPVVS